MSYHLDFLNKNTYRKYPLRATNTCISNEGTLLPDAFLCGARLCTDPAFINIYIQRIYISGNYVNILLADETDNVVQYAGYASGTITRNYQTLTIVSFEGRCSGNITFGMTSCLESLGGVNTFSLADTAIEGSLVIPLTKPAVTKITHGKGVLVGNTTTKLTNIDEIVIGSNIALDVSDKTKIYSNTDLNISYLNCGFNAISSINEVTPTTAGNIDIYGILPIKIDVNAWPIGIRLTTEGDLKFEDICGNIQMNIPPLNPVNTSGVAITELNREEWKDWYNRQHQVQYNKQL